MRDIFSERTGWNRTSNHFTLLVQKLKKDGQRVIDLTVSNPTCCGFKYLKEDLLSPLSQPDALTYEPHPKGSLSARRAISEYYQIKGMDIDPEQIFLTASTSEAYSLIFRLLCNPGESILAPAPGYPLFDFLAQIQDVEVLRYPLFWKEKWMFPQTFAENLINSKNPKAVLVVNPNNPTGHYSDQAEIDFLAKLIHKDCAIISDEVFFDFKNTDRSFRIKSFADEKRALTFTLNGISKILGLPQMKCSWIVVSGPPELVKEAMGRLEILCDTFLSVNAPVQHALPQWLSRISVIQHEIQERIHQNEKFLHQKISNHPFLTPLPREGGWYFVLKLNEKDEEKWVIKLLEEEKVCVHPGYLYDFEFQAFVLSLIVPVEEFQEGVEKLIRLK